MKNKAGVFFKNGEMYLEWDCPTCGCGNFTSSKFIEDNAYFTEDGNRVVETRCQKTRCFQKIELRL